MRNSKKSFKNKRIFRLSLVAITVFIAVIAMYIYSTFKHPFKSSGNITVNKKDTLYSVINNLEHKNILKNKILTKIYIKNNKINPVIKPGEYEIKKDMSFDDFVKEIIKGEYDKNVSKVTIPEGYTIEDIANLLEKKEVISKENFLDSVKKYEIPSYVNKVENRKYKLEGYLFPDTYVLKKGIKGKEILDAMIDRFNKVIDELNKEENLDIKKEDIDNAITMASVVEKEAKVESERSKIASVFYNRLHQNIKLQSCATVLYSLGYHKDKLYENDLKVKSPYNTYNVEGLPIGPICNPGKNSIKAALKPESTNYLYFVSKNDGTHFFTNDYNEFLKVKKQTQGF